jgi:hypothetical protein
MQITVGSVDVANMQPIGFEVNLSPNPARDLITIDFNNPLTNTVDLEILSIDGRVVYSAQVEAAKERLEVNCSKLSAAMYFVRFKSGPYTVSRKLIISR